MKKRYDMMELDCAHCAAKIEEAIRKIDGVKSAQVNFLSQKLTLDADEARMDAIQQEILKTVKKIDAHCEVAF